MKMGPDALGTVKNVSGRAKYENGTQCIWHCGKCVREHKTCKRDPTLSVPPKTSLGAQNMKTGPDALGTAENEYGSTKHENGTRRTRHRRKRVRECKI
jgi:ferredoxin